MNSILQRLRHIAVLGLFALLFPPAWSQEYSYLHYDTKDGLPSPVVHGISQDQDGFMWFATSSGLSRFDGKRFVNFTTADGLPSNEIFGTFVDSKNRIWISCFKNAVCYYYQGKIHNAANDPALKVLQLQATVNNYLETAEGAVLINCGSEAWFVYPDGKRRAYKLTKAQQLDTATPMIAPKKHSAIRILAVPPVIIPPALRRNLFNDAGNIASEDYIYSPRLHEPLCIVNEPGFFHVTRIMQNRNIITFPAALIRSCNFLNDSLVVLTNRKTGLYIVHIYTGDTVDRYLPEIRVHDFLVDREGCRWFSSDGKGVFQLCNPSFLNYPFKKNGGPASVFSLVKKDHTLYATSSYGAHWRMNIASGKAGRAYPSLPRFFSPSPAELLSLARLPLRYSDGNLKYLLHPSLPPATVKSLQLLNGKLLAATGAGTFLINTRNFRIEDTLCPIRSTYALYYDQTYFIGTTEGLRLFRNGQTSFPGRKFPILMSRITMLVPAPDGTMWISTDQGIIALKHDQVKAHITRERSGLASDMCLGLYLDGHHLWAGTAAGIDKIDLSGLHPTVIAHYDATDGLGSDIVNDLVVSGSMVYAGTQNGLTCFDESLLPRNTSCDLKLTGIRVSGRPLKDPGTATMHLPHESRNIHFDFAGISFRSAGKIKYRFRLAGLYDHWDTTTETFLDYPSLPSGKYTFELQAINKFGITSPVLRRQFEINKSFTDQTPVRFTVICLLIMLVMLLTLARQRHLQRKERQMQEIRQKMLDLEQKAMRAQMNPHFIFNCLNSIQNFILEQDARGASYYLSRFAGMVRQTLQNVSRKNISLAEEIRYLNDYLDLEQLQMTDTFHYSILTDDDLPAADILLPAMLLQPFVENAVKHGVAGMGSGGIIILSFRITNQTLECSITDNGPGILSKPGAGSATHRSMGIAITRERIDLQNKVSGQTRHISLDTSWAYEEGHRSFGTKITLRIPL